MLNFKTKGQQQSKRTYLKQTYQFLNTHILCRPSVTITVYCTEIMSLSPQMFFIQMLVGLTQQVKCFVFQNFFLVIFVTVQTYKYIS